MGIRTRSVGKLRLMTWGELASYLRQLACGDGAVDISVMMTFMLWICNHIHVVILELPHLEFNLTYFTYPFIFITLPPPLVHQTLLYSLIMANKCNQICAPLIKQACCRRRRFLQASIPPFPRLHYSGTRLD